MTDYTIEDIIEALEYLLSPVCTETQFDYCDEIRAAIALLKEQEPRVMTLEEVIHSKDWVWYQWKNTHYGWAIAVNCDGKWIEWEDSTTDQLCKYGEKWRCWTSRPTPDQMRETKWEGESDAEIH